MSSLVGGWERSRNVWGEKLVCFGEKLKCVGGEIRALECLGETSLTR